MTYSIIGILASIVLLIINRDVLHPDNYRDVSPSERNYRRFLFGVMAYYVTDFLWGFLEARRLTAVLYADTALRRFLSERRKYVRSHAEMGRADVPRL